MVRLHSQWTNCCTLIQHNIPWHWFQYMSSIMFFSICGNCRPATSVKTWLPILDYLLYYFGSAITPDILPTLNIYSGIPYIIQQHRDVVYILLCKPLMYSLSLLFKIYVCTSYFANNCMGTYAFSCLSFLMKDYELHCMAHVVPIPSSLTTGWLVACPCCSTQWAPPHC